jgi:hypothetical protein
MKVEMTQKVNISRSVWGLDGGMTKNNSSIKLTLISSSFFIWGQDWGQDFATDVAWDPCFDIKSYFYFITLNRK